jgi:hypothetical protein
MSKKQDKPRRAFNVSGAFNEGAGLRYMACEAPEAVHRWCMDYRNELRELRRPSVSVFTEEFTRERGTVRREWTVDLSNPPAFPIRPYKPVDDTPEEEE